PRARHAMVYDSFRGSVIMFGGATNTGLSSETWEWTSDDGGTWHLRLTSGPAPRMFCAMAYDSAHATTVLFGGLFNGGADPANGETWLLQRQCGQADFNHDGVSGDSADIEAFFTCLAGACCPTCGSADFNGDGAVGTDADIESFFRVLAGNPC